MKSLREILFQRILMQEIAFFDAERTGELTSRLSTDTTKVGDAIGMNTNIFLRTVVCRSKIAMRPRRLTDSDRGIFFYFKKDKKTKRLEVFAHIHSAFTTFLY